MFGSTLNGTWLSGVNLEAPSTRLAVWAVELRCRPGTCVSILIHPHSQPSNCCPLQCPALPPQGLHPVILLPPSLPFNLGNADDDGFVHACMYPSTLIIIRLFVTCAL